MSALSVEDLKVSYGDIHAVKGISFEVREGEVFTLIGANGAGKTSTLRAISGLLALGDESWMALRPTESSPWAWRTFRKDVEFSAI